MNLCFLNSHGQKKAGKLLLARTAFPIDMSVIYFIYIDAVMCLRFGRHDSSYPKSCFYCRTPFSVEQKNSSIFPWPVICQPKNTAVLYQDFPEL